jgi:hypothetical protein
MSKKLDRQLYGPSMTEVLFGAVLSLLLGMVLAAVYLVLLPVTQVKELPKERIDGVVYYIEGSRDTSKARQASAKQKAFLQGATVTVNEDEINTIIAPAPVAPPTPTKKPASGAPAAATAVQGLTAGTPNFRIKDSVLQMGIPLQVSALGFEQKVVLQTRGGFTKIGEVFAFQPSELYLGSCPLQRLPGVPQALLRRVLASVTVPPEMSVAWAKLSDVAVDGSNLRLSVP